MKLLFDGEQVLEEYLRLLKSAEKRIWIAMYMIRFDETTKQLWRVLEEKHEEGVEVVVWCDAFGCFRNLFRLMLTPFCRIFWPRILRLGARNHTKIILVDNKTAVVSGRNFTKKYFKDWVDASIFLEKQKSIKEINEFTKRLEQRPSKALSFESIFRYTDPLTYSRGVYHFVLEHIVLVKKEIVIASPYFVIDDAIRELLLAAATRGVQITVIVPAKPEHKLSLTFNRINFQRIHHPNVRVKRSKGMFHSKVMLFDDKALVGSANFDNRSFKHSMELSVVMDERHIKDIKKHLGEVADHSVNYNWVQRTYDNFLYHLTRHLMDFL